MLSTILAKFPSIFFLVFIVFFAAIASANDGSFNLKKCSNTLSDSIIERKALKGDIEAQYFLGKKYFSPSCSSSEQEKGLRFLMKASQGQHSGALYVLGYMLFETAQNDQELNYALEHLKKSSQLGYPPAKTYFGSILLHNAQTEGEKIYALELLRSAALAGDKDAASTLHHVYFSGLYNEPKNLCMAIYWLDISKKKNRSGGVVSNTKAADCFVENELKISK